MKFLLSPLLILVSLTVLGQKKTLGHTDFEIWNSLRSENISNDGEYILYTLEKGGTDNFLKVHDNKAELLFEYERAENPEFTFDSRHVIFTIKAWQDSLKEMKRKKVKSKDMPKDTLAIYDLRAGTLTKVPDVQSVKIPEKWSGFIAYLLDEPTVVKEPENEDEEGEAKSEKKKKKEKKVSKENGYHLVVRNLATGDQDTIRYVTQYTFAEEGMKMGYVTTGIDSLTTPGVYIYDPKSRQSSSLIESKGKYTGLSFDKQGEKMAFIADLDTTKVRIRPYELYLWKDGDEEASRIMDNTTAPEGYLVSNNGSLSFSDDGSRMFFGLATPPVLPDTSLLAEEIVNVEVWSYTDPTLYTMQEVQLSSEKRRTYTTVYHVNTRKWVQVEDTEFPDSGYTPERNSDVAILSTDKPYEIKVQWEGGAARDYMLVDLNTGKRKEIAKEFNGFLRLSPAGKYAYGFNSTDTSWVVYSVPTGKMTELTKGAPFFDELNDRPMLPGSYGSAGWTEDDASILIYDRYDIWEFAPDGSFSKRLTKGREEQKTYRLMQLDREAEYFEKNERWLMSVFDEKDKSSGYFEYNPRNGKGSGLLSGPYRYGYPRKAADSNELIFTRQSFVEYPDVWVSDINFKSQVKVSNANPQQKDYYWGTNELISWTSLDGERIEGMLYKPEDFDPEKKYPMMVYFYERSSNGLHFHRPPSPPRASINFSIYLSKGYLVFVPDIHYQIGYPGESAYNCIIPGVTSLIEKGFVDEDRIGVQGHSWGGYQIAYLVTRTDIFAAAESGAPVVNMFSAYGGIRWGSGRSRQFQYERTQSRIGGTIWEYPVRYIENSPIFTTDKINTPLLILHNDEDTAVPWYQGIEWFVALRRLGKPAWLVNYNGEPHGITKRQNRVDWSIRMSQFFDHYLLDAPAPMWMERGVPALEKGINQGLELKDN